MRDTTDLTISELLNTKYNNVDELREAAELIDRRIDELESEPVYTVGVIKRGDEWLGIIIDADGDVWVAREVVMSNVNMAYDWAEGEARWHLDRGNGELSECFELM